MIICGNIETLNKNESCANILKFYKENKTLVEGETIDEIRLIT